MNESRPSAPRRVGSKSLRPLPIDALEGRFSELCRPGHRLVVSAPTGSGKSTRLPWWMADALDGSVLVVEPRRVAARALATHGATIRGEVVGGRVGYRVRFDAAESDETEILFVTPGMALVLLANEPERFAGVLVDEFHERSWETDLVTALVHGGRARADVALVVCSATLARDALTKALVATSLSGEGRAFEVELRWAGRGGPSTEGLSDRVRAAVEAECAASDGDVLVFLPGKREIRECRAALSRLESASVLPLHGGLSAREIQAALHPGDGRRVFLATNVAETSLTIPTVTSVIDSGLERRHVHRGGKVVLSVVPISMASAEQRRGRAGRVRDGRCVRLWSDTFMLEASTPPQLERIELDDVLLRVGMCGIPPAEIHTLPWVTAPPAFAVEAALARLRFHGAVAPDGTLTDVGRLQARLPVSSLGARLLTEPPTPLASSLCELVAIVEVGRALLQPEPTGRQIEARAALFDGAVDEADVALRCIRDPDPARHGGNERTWNECRRLAASLKRAIGAQDQAQPDHCELARFIARRVPEQVFVRRLRADRAKRKASGTAEPWGNGDVELFVTPYVVPAVDGPPKPPVAAVVLESEWLGAGRGARGVGRMLVRLTLDDVRVLGVGTAEADRLRVNGTDVIADVVRTYAGVTVSRETESLHGDALTDALVTLVLRGTLMKGVAEPLRDALHTWAIVAGWVARELRVELPSPPSDERTYLRERLLRLGVTGPEDLALLEAEDVIPDAVAWAMDAGVDPRLARGLRDDFPRILELPGGRYACAVDVAARCVELTPIAGTKTEPAARLLPRFRNFGVVFVKASRRVRLR